MEPSSSIDELPAMMGFVEPVALREHREATVQVMQAGDEALELRTRYHAQAQDLVDQLVDDVAQARAQIGLIVQEGLMLRDGGRPSEYREELLFALTHVQHMGLEVATEVVREALMDVAVEGLRALGLDDEEFMAAVFAEAMDIGLEDPEAYVRAKGLLEGQ